MHCPNLFYFVSQVIIIDLSTRRQDLQYRHQNWRSIAHLLPEYEWRVRSACINLKCARRPSTIRHDDLKERFKKTKRPHEYLRLLYPSIHMSCTYFIGHIFISHKHLNNGCNLRRESKTSNRDPSLPRRQSISWTSSKKHINRPSIHGKRWPSLSFLGTRYREFPGLFLARAMCQTGD